MYRNPIISTKLLSKEALDGKYPFELTFKYMGEVEKIDGYCEISPFEERFQIDSLFADFLTPFLNNVVKSSIINLIEDFTKSCKA